MGGEEIIEDTIGELDPQSEKDHWIFFSFMGGSGLGTCFTIIY